MTVDQLIGKLNKSPSLIPSDPDYNQGFITELEFVVKKTNKFTIR
jgi:hypothetical protein